MQRKVVIPADWQTPGVFRARLSDLGGRQRAMAAEGHLLLVLHEPPTAATVGRHTRLFWRAPDGDWKSDALGMGVNALRTHLGEFAECVQRLEEAIERATGADDYSRLRRAAAPLRQSAHHLHAALQQGRELCPDDRDLIGCRDYALNIERAADFALDDAQHGLEYAIAKQAEEQSKAAHRLNLMAAWFWPLATLAAIFSMNVRYPPDWSSSPGTFWVVIVAGMLLGFAIRSSMWQPEQPVVKIKRERRWLDKYKS